MDHDPDTTNPVKPVPEGLDPVTKKFLPGNQMAKGGSNYTVSNRNRLHAAFYKAVGENRLIEAIERHLEAIQTARPRELAALLELLYAYCLGKPQATVAMEVSRPDPLPLTLDAEDLAALERIRHRMAGERTT